jgi:hypothetical protein
MRIAYFLDREAVVIQQHRCPVEGITEADLLLITGTPTCRANSGDPTE